MLVKLVKHVITTADNCFYMSRDVELPTVFVGMYIYTRKSPDAWDMNPIIHVAYNIQSGIFYADLESSDRSSSDEEISKRYFGWTKTTEYPE